MANRDERRWKLFEIKPDVILNVLGNWKRREHVALPVADNIPDGYEIVHVAYDVPRMAMLIVVEHPSFDPVEAGLMLPMAGTALWREELICVQPFERLWRLIAEQAEWSQRTFGDDASRGPVGPLKHLEREAKEAYEHPSDREEYADCFLLILDAARRAGMSLADLVDEAAKKLAINQQRSWETPTTDEPVFHQK